MDFHSKDEMNPTKGQHGFQKTQFCLRGHDKDLVGRRASGLCIQCHKITSQKWKRNNKTLVKTQARQHNWTRTAIINSDGTPFTHIDFDRNYQIQQGKCFMCQKHQSELSKPLCVDHDHITKIFRGLLCHSCNVSLGLLGDSIEVLESGIKYLRRGY
jgi:hypothetical protein